LREQGNECKTENTEQRNNSQQFQSAPPQKFQSADYIDFDSGMNLKERHKAEIGDSNSRVVIQIVEFPFLLKIDLIVAPASRPAL
jgi:hypothetical protein